MPTLFRMLLVLIVLGGGFIGILAFLGSAGEPQPSEVTINVPLAQIGPNAAQPDTQ